MDLHQRNSIEDRRTNREDLERKVQRGPRPWKTQEEDHQQASTSFNQTALQSQNQFSHEQLPQRDKKISEEE